MINKQSKSSNGQLGSVDMVKLWSISFSACILSLGIGISPASALTDADPSPKPLSFKACGAKYQAAKADGSLGQRKWLEYRRAECGISVGTSQARQPAPVAKSEAAASELLRRGSFPGEIAGEFMDQKPAQQRMRTCLKSYHANKQAGTLAGLRWVQKGGGYYSQCTAKLKAIKA